MFLFFIPSLQPSEKQMVCVCMYLSHTMLRQSSVTFESYNNFEDMVNIYNHAFYQLKTCYLYFYNLIERIFYSTKARELCIFPVNQHSNSTHLAGKLHPLVLAFSFELLSLFLKNTNRIIGHNKHTKDMVESQHYTFNLMRLQSDGFSCRFFEQV